MHFYKSLCFVCVVSKDRLHCIVSSLHGSCARETGPWRGSVCVCVCAGYLGATIRPVYLEDKMFLWLGLALKCAPWICGLFIFEVRSVCVCVLDCGGLYCTFIRADPLRLVWHHSGILAVVPPGPWQAVLSLALY